MYLMKNVLIYDVKEFNPTIIAKDNINYQMLNSNKLNVGENLIKIEVTGNNLKTSIYKFKINRQRLTLIY